MRDRFGPAYWRNVQRTAEAHGARGVNLAALAEGVHLDALDDTERETHRNALGAAVDQYATESGLSALAALTLLAEHYGYTVGQDEGGRA